MLTIFMTIAIAYFWGLGCMGFLLVLGLLEIQRERGKWSSPAVAILKGLHGCLTIGGILVATKLYAKYDADMTDEIHLVATVMLIVMFYLTYVVAKKWHRLLQEKGN